MKTSYVVRLPYDDKPFKQDKYSLSKIDIEILKDRAKEEGRSLRVYLAKEIKMIARKNIDYKIVEKK